MKIALYKNAQYGFTTVYEVNDYMENSSDSIRISEILDIEFPPLPNETLTKNQITALRTTKTNLQAETELKLQKIDQQIAELLALPNLNNE